MRKFITLARLVFACVYSKHVSYQFLPAMLDRPGASATLPPGYESRQPPDAGDDLAIAALLNREPGFGTWTGQRVHHELYARMATPSSGIVLLHDGVPVGVAFAIDASTRWRRMAHGTYLYLDPGHRVRGQLGVFLVRTILRSCVDGGYEKIIAYTDPDRYSALLLYLSTGALPRYDSLISFWYWRRILRRLGPALVRAETQRRRRDAVHADAPQVTRPVGTA